MWKTDADISGHETENNNPQDRLSAQRGLEERDLKFKVDFFILTEHFLLGLI